jgi:hypothetical protein
MTRLLAIPLLAAILTLSACVLSGNNTAKTPPAPAPPAATAAAKPAAPPPPLSTPQTQVQLPPAQSLSAAALATIPTLREELPAPEEPAAPAKPPVNRKPPAAANSTPTTTPKPEQPGPAAETPSPVQGPTPPAVTTPAEEQPRLTPVYTEEERRRIWGELEKRKTDIEAVLRVLSQRRISPDQKNLVERIRSFMTAADESARRGDFRSAEALADKAMILLRELTSGR